MPSKPESNHSRVNLYVAVITVFCALVAIVAATDPVPALGVPLQIVSLVVLLTMAFLLGKEAKSQGRGSDRQD